MAQLPTGLVTHSRKVCSLYKRALRCVEDFAVNRAEFRYNAVLLRARFDENRNVVDARIAKKLLLDGEEELFQNQHPQPIKFPTSLGGTAYQREADIPDYVVDYWDPMEKAMYPKYFAKREEMKKEYEQLYYKLYPETPKSTSEKK